MATTSRIAILNFDGSVDSIYCHYDGYLSHNGKILLKYYNDEMKIRKLIFLGDISNLGKNLECVDSFNSFPVIPDETTTISYHRDRGEPLKIKRYNSFAEWMEKPEREQWNYIWMEKKWFVVNSKDNNLTELSTLFS